MMGIPKPGIGSNRLPFSATVQCQGDRCTGRNSAKLVFERVECNRLPIERHEAVPHLQPTTGGGRTCLDGVDNDAIVWAAFALVQLHSQIGGAVAAERQPCRRERGRPIYLSFRAYQVCVLGMEICLRNGFQA